MTGLLLALALAQPMLDGPRFQRFNSRGEPGRSDRGFDNSYSYALFEFAPPTGAGMGTACACSTITGAKGEALTFSRASTATCTKGNPTSGIANGDLVTCASGQPRVGNPDGAGLKLLVEGSRTNNVIQSQSIDNAAWTKTGTLVAAPVVTADFAVAPDGTQTAERVQFAACPSAGNDSIITISASAFTPATADTVYLKGTSGSGTVTLTHYNSGTATAPRVTCAFNPTTWTRCENDPTYASTAAASWILGCTRTYGGSPDTGAADVLVWGAQSEQAAYATSYIPTTTVAVTRATDSTPLFSSVTALAGLTTGSMAATVIPLAVVSDKGWLTLDNGASNTGLIEFPGAGSVQLYLNNTSNVTSGSTLTANVSSRIAAYFAAGGNGACVNGNCTTTTGATSPGWTPTNVALMDYYVTSRGLRLSDGYIGNVCVDSSSTRCR